MKSVKTNEMFSKSAASFVFIILSIGCGIPRSSTPIPIPTPTSPTPQPTASTVPSAGSWSFKYSPGALSYQIERSAVIERSDSISQREISTNSTHELVTLQPVEVGFGFTAVVDAFKTTTQSLIGPVQPMQLPLQISGAFGDTLTLNGQAVDSCSPVHTVLIADLHNLFVKFPTVLSPGVSWKDSVNMRGCQSGIPTLAHTLRSYVVSGEVIFEGRSLVLILRADTTSAQGEGGLQQHRASINLAGTGTAAYYLSPVTGQVVHLTVNQTLDLGVTTTAKVYRFRQSSKQEFRLSF